MDNKAYLDTIAVKGKNTSGPSIPLLSPTIIKFVAVGIVAIIAMIAVTAILNTNNTGLQTTYEKIYGTYAQLTLGNSPIELYREKLKASEVRAATVQLQTSLKNTNNQLKNVAGSIGVDTAALSAEATEAVSLDVTALSVEFENGYYNGTLDRSFAAAVYLQLSKMIAMQTEAMQQTDNQAFATVLNNSINDLKNIQEQYKNFIDAV